MDLENFKKRLAIAQRTAAHFEGRKDQLLARDAELVNKIGFAKGRVQGKPERDAFLERLQANSMQEAVGRYSKLLTSLVQDIVPGDRKVGLELYTHSGLPALDIFTSLGGDPTKFDPVDQDSGAVVNCICLGLRTIATANSGLRKFLLLDEPDCWVEGENVKAFYRILGQLANQKDMQILVISHKSLNFFEPSANIIQVEATENGLRADIRAGARTWASPDCAGIRRITLKNVATYADVTIPLSPGMNVIRGDNGSGKSRAGRNMRGVMYGGSEINDADIRLGEDRASSEYELENGRVLHWSKQRGKNPTWQLVDDKGEVVVIDGERCENVGHKVVPGWVAKNEAAGIARVLGLDIQLAHQKEPVFLLKEAVTKKASVLSIGRESGWLQGMIASEKENHNRDREIVKQGEIELNSIREQLALLIRIEEISNLVRVAEKSFEGLNLLGQKLNEQGAMLGHWTNFEKKYQETVYRLECLKDLPDNPDISSQVFKNNEIRAAGILIRKLTEGLRLQAKRVELLSQLPINPEIVETASCEQMAAYLSNHQKQIAVLKKSSRVLAKLPDAEIQLVPTQSLKESALKIGDLFSLSKIEKNKLAVLNGLPEQPKTENVDDLSRVIESLLKTGKELGKAQSDKEDNSEKLQQQALAVAETVDLLGNMCPLCGSAVEHTHLLNGVL